MWKPIEKWHYLLAKLDATEPALYLSPRSQLVSTFFSLYFICMDLSTVCVGIESVYTQYFCGFPIGCLLSFCISFSLKRCRSTSVIRLWILDSSLKICMPGWLLSLQRLDYSLLWGASVLVTISWHPFLMKLATWFCLRSLIWVTTGEYDQSELLQDCIPGTHEDAQCTLSFQVFHMEFVCTWVFNSVH